MKATEMMDAKVKEMIARIQRAGIAVTSDGLRMVIGKSLGDKNKAEGVGQGRAHEGDSEGESAAQWAEIDYPLAKPRLVEAPNNDSSTVVQSTGQDRSPTGPCTMVNPPYTQHRGRDNLNKDVEAGLDSNENEDKGAGLNRNMTKDHGAGLDGNMIEDEPVGPYGNLIKDEPAGLDGDEIEDVPAGLDVDINKDEPAGLDRNMTEDEPAGLGGNIIKDEPAGLDANVTEDEQAGLDNKPHSEAVRRIK